MVLYADGCCGDFRRIVFFASRDCRDGADCNSGDQRFTAAGLQQYSRDDRNLCCDDRARVVRSVAARPASAVVSSIALGPVWPLTGDVVLFGIELRGLGVSERL